MIIMFVTRLICNRQSLSLNIILLFLILLYTYKFYSPKRSPAVIEYSDGVSYVQATLMSDSTILFTANRTHKLQQGEKRIRVVSYNNCYCRSFGRVSAVRLRRSSAAREYLGNGRPSGHSASPTLPSQRSKPVGTAA